MAISLDQGYLIRISRARLLDFSHQRPRSSAIMRYIVLGRVLRRRYLRRCILVLGVVGWVCGRRWGIVGIVLCRLRDGGELIGFGRVLLRGRRVGLRLGCCRSFDDLLLSLQWLHFRSLIVVQV